jgi:DNA-binding protein Fis
MRLLKIFVTGLLIQGILLSGSVQAQMMFDSAARENMSPEIYFQDKSLQNAFILKLGNEVLFDALQKNGWSVTATAKALGTYPSEIARRTSPEQIAKKKGEYRYILNSLIQNKFSLEKTKAELGIGRKKIINTVGKEVIEQGRQTQRIKEIEAEKAMIICALQAYRWNVALASKETGIWSKRIRELIPSEIIKLNRKIAEQELKQLIIRVLAENEWNVIAALADRRLVEMEVGRHILYSMLSHEWISEQKGAYIKNIEQQQKQEILAAINMFIRSRDCLNQVAKYLNLPRGTLRDRLGKYKISIDDIRYDPKKILPVLVQTRNNLSQAEKLLGLNRQVIGRKFPEQIALIKATGTYEMKPEAKQELLDMVDRFISSKDCLQDVGKALGLNSEQLKQRFKECRINIFDIMYRPELILPVLVKTKGDAAKTAEILGLDKQTVKRRFNREITRIKQLAAARAAYEQEIRAVVIPVLEETNADVEITASRLYLSADLIKKEFAADIEQINYRNTDKKRLLNAINLFISRTLFFQDLSCYLGISINQLNDILKKHKINVFDIRYKPERVVPVLEQTGGNARRAAAILGLDRQLIRKRFLNEIKKIITEKQELAPMLLPVLEQNGGDVEKAAETLSLDKLRISRLFTVEISRIKQKKIDKQELLSTINIFVNSKNCLHNAAVCLNLSDDELKSRLKAHNIVLDNIRYSEERVLPVLAQTKANLAQTAKILRLNRQVISRRFSQAILAIQENRYDYIVQMFSKENTEHLSCIPRKQELVNVVTLFAESGSCLSDAANYLKISELKLKKELEELKISLADIKYSAERVIPVLKQTNGSIRRTAEILNLDSKEISARFAKDIAQIKADAIDKLKIIEAINKFTKNRDCLQKVSEYLGIAQGTLKDKLRKHNISVYAIKYSRDNVFPILLETRGNLTQAAEKLRLNRAEIAKRFSAEIEQIKKLPKLVCALYKFELIDKRLECLSDKIFDIDNADSQEVESLSRVAEFTIYRCRNMIEQINAMTVDSEYSAALKAKSSFYEKCLNRIAQVLACKSADVGFTSCLLNITAVEIRVILNQRINNFTTEQVILAHSNRLSEASKAEMLINNSI